MFLFSISPFKLIMIDFSDFYDLVFFYLINYLNVKISRPNFNTPI